MQGVIKEVLASLVIWIFWLVILDVLSPAYKWVPMPSTAAERWAPRATLRWRCESQSIKGCDQTIPVIISTIWKFKNRTCWQRRCNQCYATEHRFSCNQVDEANAGRGEQPKRC